MLDRYETSLNEFLLMCLFVVAEDKYSHRLINEPGPVNNKAHTVLLSPAAVYANRRRQSPTYRAFITDQVVNDQVSQLYII